MRVTKRSSLTISHRIDCSPPEKVRERCGHSSIWQSATLPTSRLSVRGRLSAPSLQRPKCSVWSFSAHMKSGARKGVAVMEKVLAVCRLARSKSSALGAENRRFKSFHTDQRLIVFFGSKTPTFANAANVGEALHRVALLAPKCRASLPTAYDASGNGSATKRDHWEDPPFWKVGRAAYRT